MLTPGMFGGLLKGTNRCLHFSF